MDWSDSKNAFNFDGALRDIYVLNTSLAAWGRFLDLVAPLKTASSIGGQPMQLPTQASEIFERNSNTTFSLKITVEKVNFHCHFFTETEIELDIDPREVTSLQELDAVVGMLVNIGKSLNKDVVLTEENSQRAWWLLFLRRPRKGLSLTAICSQIDKCVGPPS